MGYITSSSEKEAMKMLRVIDPSKYRDITFKPIKVDEPDQLVKELLYFEEQAVGNIISRYYIVGRLFICFLSFRYKDLEIVQVWNPLRGQRTNERRGYVCQWYVYIIIYFIVPFRNKESNIFYNSLFAYLFVLLSVLSCY